ncbi:hypothetical protein LY78DRAFT_661873 [Colletotrichum sublineola]|uniref:ATP phosphoribosyltransferase n=1 Tax=Colletotrichum sublineola TaxID=1173701 RepID=A0A066XMR9_COLSU|nr:hypothetical protein LY78DRAFT_661873 [Colletotrichum sublineola]KDN68969.1 hypothetical protein CSUB01_07338 [Colletotrichum sublineola]
MSSSTTATKVTATRGGSDVGAFQQSTLYKGIVTPIIFISFLLSLMWVDIRYTIQRSRNHNQGGWMPSWLHNVMYQRSPYHYVQARDQKNPRPAGEKEEWYYHSKQKKLIRMEVDDAFQMRGHVLVVLALVSLAVFWGVWLFSSWVWRSFGSRAFGI